jgi:molybdate transport system substrate-binding protein
MTTRVRRFGAVAAAVTAFGAGGCSTPAPQDPVSPSASSPAAAPEHHHHGSPAPIDPAGSAAPHGRLIVHADEQMRSVLRLLVEQFREAFPATTVVIEYGTGAGHARHLAGDAAVDVLITGDAGTAAGVATRAEPVTIARNPLVIATARTKTEVNDVTDLRRPAVRVAVCGEHTRCGDAARTIAGLHPTAVGKDGPATVAAVVSGGADAALVHRTDVVAARADLRVVDFADGVARADQYAVVLPRHGRNPTAADAFRSLMCSALAQRMLSDAGFSAA